MEDAEDFTQVNISQAFQDAGVAVSLLPPNHNYDLARNSQDFGCQSQERGKLFNDPVHGHFRLDPVAVKIIDTPQFQRLADLKQLGCTYYVFRGASHNRAEHSMGVAHLAYTLANQVYMLQGKELDISRSDVKCAEVAGLVHDLGHGPYSHVFDRFMARKGRPWHHEKMSVDLLEDILGGEQSHTISRYVNDEEIKHIKDMITSEKGGQPAPPGKRWLYEIVANNRNGLDVDKYDYLQRDSMYSGTKISVDVKRIFPFVKVLDDELCYKYSEYHNIFEVFSTRARMFRSVYLHKKANAVEHMIMDAFVEADPFFKLADATEDAQAFALLDDSILKTIEHYGAARPGFGSFAMDADDDGSTSVRSAQAIIKRLRKRDLYKFVEEFLVPQGDLRNGTWRMPTPAEVLKHGKGNLQERDIIISEAKVDLTKGDQNPMDNVSFFDYPESTEKKTVPRHHISAMFPECNREHWCRVFTRNSAPEVVEATQAAMREFLREQYGARVEACTPIRKKRPVAEPCGPTEAGEPPSARKRILTYA
ncbi:hypothetical protein CVIRNUC_010259 [Coccomyxa viridis]|uniref:HD domain-containing protein n=1 Tax=Coccomyxa viridis TaxID=1274662 RepID=A0AAV1IID2_9CHLO|nr:hypothetical protein CVIRNUC_010259 [Coccomyxa viridis]